MATEDRGPHNFGANYWVVDEMYKEYLDDPDSVGEGWKEFFSDYQPLSGKSAPNGAAPAAQAPPAPAPAAAQPADDGTVTADEAPDDASVLRGVGARIAENMDASRSMPTATSIRVVPAKLLEVNRKIINNQLIRTRGGKLSFTHIIGWAIVQAMMDVRAMTYSYMEVNDKPHVRKPEQINLGLAVDIQRKDGRTLLVPNVKGADSLDFAGFFAAYEDLIRKIRTNDLDPAMFEGTTATLTNPGTVGTVGSVPRLMPGQSAIIGVGAIDYPAEYQAAHPHTLAEIGVGKVITITSTYDHRVIQGAESGLFLKKVHELLTGSDGFYDGIFNSLHIPYEPVRWHTDDNPRIGGASAAAQDDKQVAVSRLINQYRVRGHLIANLNPLADDFTEVHPELDPATYGLTIWDLDRRFATGGLGGRDRLPLGDILGVLRDAYCRTVGVEYMHIQEPDQKTWIQDRVEGVSTQLEIDDQKLTLSRLNAAEAFEKFLATKYVGHKRFGVEGAESAIAMLGALLDSAADSGITDAVIGMAHRGRLNVLANILHKPLHRIFGEFEGNIDPESTQGSGDVKYHLGSTGAHMSPAGNEITVELSANPSHLEAVDPVVQGMARAKLEMAKTAEELLERQTPVLPVLLHGDAAFAGQGVVAETFAMSQLRGYRTGGTVHLVINNQVGFTTGQDSARSSTYATDVAKMVQAPIFHVNGDDPEACVRVMRLAFEFRKAFGKDVVVDLICYRRHGHNEGDDPSLTQPVMYSAIENHRSVRKLYTEELVVRGDLSLDEAEQAMDDFRERLESALAETRGAAPPEKPHTVKPPTPAGVLPAVDTGVKLDTLEQIITAVTSAPDDFTIHPKLQRQLEKRRAQLSDDAIDWAMGEAFAFGTLVMEGTRVRLAGQDSRRGTFVQRHSVLIDNHSAAEHTPLAALTDDQARFTPYDSYLSEYAAMGFEYGYSVIRKDALVMWEAQFGDFVNGAQIIIDQFLVSAEDKWNQTSGLVLLLPHGYEGQGPEHSSARIERFLVLCANDNIQVAQPTTPAQYFHLLRRQMHREVRKPLIVATPKSLLRAKAATSSADEFTSGSFAEVLTEPSPPAADDVSRIILCSGRVYYDVLKTRDEGSHPTAIARIEQLYPWPGEQVREVLRAYPDADEVVFVQDEPENMGAWPFMRHRLEAIVREEDRRLMQVTRYESASPATGSQTIHEHELTDLMDRAFGSLD